MKLLDQTSVRYQLPGEEPVTKRGIIRSAGYAVGLALMYGASAATIFMLAYAVANSVGYP